MESWSKGKQKPDYYGSLEHLPIAPLKGKPPPYASRKQHDARRGNQHLLKGYRVLSNSVGDLSTPSNRSKTNSVTNNGGSWEEWYRDAGNGGGGGGGGGGGIPQNPRQRHGSMEDESNAPTATPTPHSHHQRQGSVSYSSSKVTKEAEERTHGRSCHMREQGVAQNKATQERTQGDRNAHSKKGSSRESPGAVGGETSCPESASPTEMLDRKQNSSNSNTLKNYREFAAIPDHTLVRWSRSKSMNDLITSEDDGINSTRDDHKAYSEDRERRTAQTGSLRSRSKDQVDCGREERVTSQEARHSATSPSSPSPSLPSSPIHSPFTINQKRSRGGDDGGLFVATPVFLESSPSASPSASPPPSLLHQDSVDSERDSDLSTLRREILRLTNLKQEIEQNFIRSQAMLKEEVSGLQEERGGLESAVEQREKQLHAQEAEIQDLKNTVTQLQTLVFASDGEVRLQRQASDLQEQLREEKRHRLEETARLMREVQALATRLQDKENQLEKYKSDPSLSSWDSRGLGNDITESWKTSLPDVRKGEVLPFLGVSVAERRKSFSGMSDSSDDSLSFTVVSTHSWKYRAKEDLPGRFNGAFVQPYKAEDSSRNSVIAPVNDSKSSADPMKSNGAPVKASLAVVIPGKPDMTPTNEPMSSGAPARSHKAVEPSRRSRTEEVDDSVSHAAPTRPHVPVESFRRSGMEAPDKPRTNGASARSDNSILTSEKSAVASFNITKPYMAARGESLQSGAGKGKTDHTSDEKGKTRVKTTVYVELEDYSRPGGSDGRHQGGGYKRSGSYEEKHKGGDYEAPRRTSAPPVTKSSVPTVSHRVTSPSTVPLPLHIPRPSAPPPLPPQVTRVAGTHVITRPHDPPMSPEVSRSTCVPSQATGTSQVIKLGSASPSSPQVTMSQRTQPARNRSGDPPQVPGDKGTSARTSWMYNPVSESGDMPVRGEGKKRDLEVPTGDTRMLGVKVNGVGEAGRGVGGTSYISATIQCLFTLPPLRRFFAEKFWHLGVRSEVAVAVAGAFWAVEDGTGEHRAMQCLRAAVQQRDKVFLLHQDPPAADLLSCLLAWLHSDLTPYARPKVPLASSVVSQLFHGVRESVIVCPTRGRILSSALESFNFLTLSVPGEGAWSLQELLARRFHPQEMAWECQPCGQWHPCSHQTHLLQPPQVLVLYLRRLHAAAAARVLFPEAGLVLAVHQNHETRTLRSPEYQLLGVVSRGDREGGGSHYTAFCRRLEGGLWGLWEEQRTAPSSRREVLSQQGAHLLFYMQQEESQQAQGGR